MLHNQINVVAQLIERESGILYQGSNLYQLQNRLEELQRLEASASVDDVVKNLLSGDPRIRHRLVELATNNETLFFRDPGFFVALEKFITEHILPTKPTELRIWSAAASTGQEALSVAMTLDQLRKKTPLPPFSITATDIADRAIKKANSGAYSDFEVMRGLSPQFRDQYFRHIGDQWHVEPQLRSTISFGLNNLIKSQVRGPFHVILCRNVLIYQRLEMKKIVTESLLRELHPTGGLMLGVGETMLGITESFTPTMIGNVIVYQGPETALKKVS